MNIRLLLLVVCLITTTGCNIDCVEPGLQSRNTTVQVDVPLRAPTGDSKILWVDSGQTVARGEKVTLILDSSMNTCPFTQPKKVLVPASFCKDGEMPDYSKAEDINNEQLADDYGINEPELCSGGWEDSNNMPYVDTGIRVNPGDEVRFRLVPRKVEIDCESPRPFEKKIILEENYYTTDNPEDRTKVTASKVCQGGIFYLGKNRIEVPKKGLNDKVEGSDCPPIYEILVGNGYTPYDNKVIFDKKDHKNLWINGSLLDERVTKNGLSSFIESFNKLHEKEREKYEVELTKYESYEINCHKQNICYGAQRICDCVSSIRYKRFDKDDGKCSLPSSEEVNKGLENIDLSDDHSKNISWAEALVAKVGNDFHDLGTGEGQQYFPNGDGFKSLSLQLNHDYEVNNNVKPQSPIMLGIADATNNSRGGYHVEVSRLCNENKSGERLYLYLCDDSKCDLPKDLSGVNNTKFFKVLEGLTKEEGHYIIKSDEIAEGKSAKIYFGIDTSNIVKDDILDRNGQPAPNTKYSVALFFKKEINTFISSNVNKIIDFVENEILGIDKDDITKNVTKTAYEWYKKGLINVVRALLVLYVIFSVVGYMLGTVQLSQFDFVIRMMKIAFVSLAFSDRSWELLGKNLSLFFIEGSGYLIDSFSGYIGTGKRFEFLDLTAGVLFSGETWLKFLSLVLAGPFGLIAFVAIMYATFTFLKCIIGAIMRYTIAIVLGSFLLSLTPLFIAFILFQRTKGLFDGWIKSLIHISVKPVILLSSLSLLNQLMYSVLYNLTNFSACSQCLINLEILFGPGSGFCLLRGILPVGYIPGGGSFVALPLDLLQAVIYLIVASAMKAFVEISEQMTQALFSSSYGVSQVTERAMHTASQALLSPIGLDDNAQSTIKHIRNMGHKDPPNLNVEGKINSTESINLKGIKEDEKKNIEDDNSSKKVLR